ncbi:hypothetical protein MTR_6g073070 [Medicago truncatula]|uniref:Uncharacterized protein n=1 Tax=Medicago truncatula TaxID=3880 RepID=A0A072UAI5_MEDTR|nr:hypothetical protein MTR_6g073070 [Medicago truncatula]
MWYESRASSPQHIEHKYTSRASSPELKEKKLTGHQALNSNETKKSFSPQTKATGKLTQLSTTFMFTPKANSKQKRVKKTQEHETGRVVRDQLGKTHFSPQNPNFNFPMPKFDPKTWLTISVHVKALKTI